jgi:hypothetical protein
MRTLDTCSNWEKDSHFTVALQDLFSIDYISKLWGTSQKDPWPREVIL